jgi:hypothetical protein
MVLFVGFGGFGVLPLEVVEVAGFNVSRSIATVLLFGDLDVDAAVGPGFHSHAAAGIFDFDLAAAGGFLNMDAANAAELELAVEGGREGWVGNCGDG